MMSNDKNIILLEFLIKFIYRWIVSKLHSFDTRTLLRADKRKCFSNDVFNDHQLFLHLNMSTMRVCIHEEIRKDPYKRVRFNKSQK